MIAAFVVALVAAVGTFTGQLVAAIGGSTFSFLHVYPLGVAGIYIIWRVIRRVIRS